MPVMYPALIVATRGLLAVTADRVSAGATAVVRQRRPPNIQGGTSPEAAASRRNRALKPKIGW